MACNHKYIIDSRGAQQPQRQHPCSHTQPACWRMARTALRKSVGVMHAVTMHHLAVTMHHCAVTMHDLAVACWAAGVTVTPAAVTPVAMAALAAVRAVASALSKLPVAGTEGGAEGRYCKACCCWLVALFRTLQCSGRG